MRAACVETVPGGLLDFLAHAVPAEPITQALVRGRRGEAAATVPVTAGPAMSAWHYVARHAALLALPDDGALPYLDPVDPRPPWPHQPDDAPPGHPEQAISWILVQVCAGLRDLRGMLPPLSDPRISPAPGILAAGLRVIERTRAEVVPGRPDLDPYLDLLAADLAARAGADDLARPLLASARTRFTTAGQLSSAAAAAAAAVVEGDWNACPFASPSTWGLALGSPTGQDSSLSDLLESPEQSPPADPEHAADAYAEAEALYAQVGDHRGLAHVAWRRAYLAQTRGDGPGAAEVAAAAADALSAAGDERAALIARAHGVLARLAVGELPVVEEVVAPIAEWAHGPGSLADAVGIGRMFARTGRRLGTTTRRCELALAASQIADALWQALGRTGSQSQARSDQASTLRSLGARQAAVVTIESALELAMPALAGPAGETVMDVGWARPMLLLADLYNLANAAMDTEAMQRAVRRLEQFSTVLHDPATRATPEQATIADHLLHLVAHLDHQVIGLLFQAQAARDDGDAERAARLFAAAEAAVPTGAAGRDGDAPLLAIVRAFELRLEEAAALYRDWLDTRLADLAALAPDATSAGAAALLRQQERAVRSQAVFFAVRTGDVATARTQLTALRTLADPWWSGLGPSWEHDDVEGRLLEAEADLDGAAAAFGRAVDAVERVRAELRRDDLRVSFGADRVVQQVYRHAARIALRRQAACAPDDPARRELGLRAVRMLELARSRALFDLLTTSAIGLPPAAVDAWRGAQADAALARDRLAAALDADPPDPATVDARRAVLRAAEGRLDDSAERLRATDPRFWELARPATIGPAATDPAEVVGTLGEGELVLVFSVDRPDLVSLALTRHGPASATWSREERRVDPAAGRLLRACTAGGDWTAAADELGALLLEPHAAVLEHARRVYVLASGSLLAVPFPLLRHRGRCLLDDHVVSVLPNLTSYALLAPHRGGTSVLCVGDPARMSVRPVPEAAPVPLGALPGAAVEAAAVARLYGAEPLLGKEARYCTVRERLPSAAVIHLATHGIVDPLSPLGSSVLLADGATVTVAELLSLRMTADLVVLSACQTGTGARPGGEELLGLARGLLAAGARVAVVSLWPVDDRVTAVLMERFHATYRRGSDAASALRDAQVWLRQLSRSDLEREHERLIGPTGAPPAAGPVPATALRTVSTAPPARRPADPGSPALWAPFILIGRG